MNRQAIASIPLVHAILPAYGCRREALLIDAALDDGDVLAAGARAGMDVVRFGGGSGGDGLAELARWAAMAQDYDALHLLCHGAAGLLMLGARTLDRAALTEPQAQQQLGLLGRALDGRGCVLVYGCNAAQGAQGRAFIAELALALGVPVAASAGLVGAAALGGSWRLEHSTGEVRAGALEWPGYRGTLAIASTTTDFSSILSTTSYQVLTSGFPAPATLTQTDIAGSGWDVSAQATVNSAAFQLRGINSLGFGDGDNTSIRIQAADVDHVIFKSNANGFYFDLSTFTMRNTAAANFTVQALDVNGALTGSAVALSIPGGTGFSQLSLAGNSDFTGIFGFKITFTTAADSPYIDNLAVANIGIPAVPTTTVATAALSADTGGSGSDFVTYTALQTISGTLSANLASGETVQVSYDGGGSWNDATAFATGSSAWSTVTTLAGSHTFMARVTNTFGSSAAYSHSYTLDTAAPAAPATPDLDAGSDSGSASSDNTTSDTTPTVSGSAESGSSVILYDSDGSTALGTATATGGTWSITSSALSQGTHNLTAKATDLAGNVSAASSALAVAVDTTAPASLALSAGTVTTSGAAGGATIGTLSGTDSHAITYALAAGNGVNDADNGSFAISGNALNVGGSALGAGSYKVYLSATDAAGNVSNLAQTITVQSIPAVSSIARAGGAPAGVAGSATSASYTVTFSESVSNVDAGDFALTATGTASGAIAGISGSGSTYTITVDTLAGDGTLRLDLNGSATGILASDDGVAIAAGYTSGSTYTLDHTAPSAPSMADLSSGSDTGSANSDNITSSTTPTLTGTAESGSTVTLYDSDGSTVLGTAVATGGAWSITSSALGQGTHNLTIKAADVAGNVSSASAALAVAVDTAAPSGMALSGNIVATLSAGGGAPVATLSATDSQAITYALATGNGVNDADNGSFALSGNALNVGGSALSAGTYLIYLSATDAAGNISYLAQTITVANLPTVSSIVRAGGAPATVAGSATTVDYTVTFSESVSGVDASDFGLTATGTAGASIGSVSGSGDTYTVSVNALAGDGTLRLDLNGSGTNIENGSSIGIASGYTSGSTYTLDHTAPAVASIALGGAASTKAASVTYVVTFAESVTGVNAADFELTAGGSAAGTIATVNGAGTTYTVTVNNATGDGTLRLDLKASGTGIADAAGNAIAAGHTGGAPYTFDHTAPGIQSIAPAGAAATNAASATYTVTFAESVSGVDAADFDLAFTGTANGSIGAITGSGGTYSVTADNLSGEGTVRLDLNGSGTAIVDGVNNAAAAGYTGGTVLTLDRTAPTLAITSGKAALAVGETATITFTFSEDPGSSFTWNGSSGDVTLSGGTLGALSGSGTVRTATFTAATAGAASVTVAAASYADTAGNDGGGGTSPVLTVSAAPTDPGTPPVPGTVDGVPTQTETSTDPATGLVNQSVTVPVIVPGRQEDPSSPHSALADIPLGLSAAGGAPATQLTVSLPTGTGLVASGATTLLSNSQALQDLILRIESRTQSGSDTQADMTGQGGGFLSQLGTDVKLQTKTLVLSSVPGAGAASIEILGSSAAPPAGGSNATAIGIVIDASQLPGGSMLTLNDVDFAAVVGAVTVRGGSGRNFVSGDGASQNIMLGAEDDFLSGGAGNDFIGSMGGNDTLDGGADNDLAAGGADNDVLRGGTGSDMLQGGRSDTGGWQFLVSASGQLTAQHDHAVFAAGQLETVLASELSGTAKGLAFLAGGSSALVDVALLYGALERAPDLAGLDFWAQRGLSPLDVAQGILQSAEWQAANGAQSDSAFVAGLYQHLLGRAAEAAGQQYWEGWLAQGMSRAQVLLGVALSPEHRALALTAQGYTVGSGSVAREQGWFAGSGDDRLDGGAGGDTLAGGDGADTAVYGGAQASYRFLLGVDGQLKLGDKANADIDTLSSIEAAAFSDATLDLAFLQAPQAQLEKLGLLYQAVLDRAGDVAGMRWWLERGDSAGSGGWAAGFAASAEFKARYDGISDAAFVQALYSNSGLADTAAGGAAAWQAYLAGHTRVELIGAWIAQHAVRDAQFGADGLWLV